MSSDESLRSIAAPVIAVEGYDVQTYPSAEYATAQYCLAEDSEGIRFFDSTARILRAEILSVTEFRLLPTDVVDKEGLRFALVEHLRCLGEPIGDDAQLDWLLERQLDRQRHSRPLFNFWPFRRRSDRSG